MSRLLLVQYSGDFRAAWSLRQEKGVETYYGHGYILDQLGEMARKYEDVGFLCCTAPSYEERLPNGVMTMGANARPGIWPAPILEKMKAFRPTHLIIHGPMPALIRWGVKQQIAVGCVFADSFHIHPLLRRVRFGWLPRLLNHSAVTLVANHGTNAAQGLIDIGVRADKVIPWDFPHSRQPEHYAAKTGLGDGPVRLFYAGSVVPKKGVGDLIDAVAALKPKMQLELQIAGGGQVEHFRHYAEKKGVTDQVRFLGFVPNADVMRHMQEADIVVVPSRHNFPEGLPLTLYEGLASRTPVIASDHPMFRGHIVSELSAMIFPAGNGLALAQQVERLVKDQQLYARISLGSADAWHRMQLQVKWGTMIDRWVSGTAADRDWLDGQSIAMQSKGSA